jgi:predicted transcriptional regulator of viral defense system
MGNKHQVKLEVFFADHPVFTLDEVASFAAQRLSPAAVTARLSYATRTGRIRSISRGIYVVTPPGRSALTTHVDPFLVATYGPITAANIGNYHGGYEPPFCHAQALGLFNKVK